MSSRRLSDAVGRRVGMQPRAWRFGGWALVALAALALGLASLGARPASAALTLTGGNGDVCGSSGSTAVGTGNIFECDYTTTGTITVAGGLVLIITSPAGTVFDATTPAAQNGCTVTPAGATLTIN